MNNRLTYEIAYHITSKFGLTEHESFLLDKSNSLLNKKFLSDKRISFQEEDDEKSYKVYSSKFEYQNLKLILSCFKTEDALYLSFNMPGAPTYGVMLSLESQDALIAYKIKNWHICPMSFQGTLLAGLEQTTDIPIDWSPVQSLDQESFDLLKEFVVYSDDLDNFNEKE